MRTFCLPSLGAMLLLLLLACASPCTAAQEPPAAASSAATAPSLSGGALPPMEKLPPKAEPEPAPGDSPVTGLRRMLRAMDALIAAFQDESETFTMLVEIYKAGGPLWERVEACIQEAHRELREGESI